MTVAFQQHDKRWYKPRPSWNRGATINGRPAWQVVEERRNAARTS